MRMASSFSSSPRLGMDADFDDNDSFDLNDDREYDGHGSNEGKVICMNI